MHSYIFSACHFHRGGGTKSSNMPIPYSELLTLRENCVRVLLCSGSGASNEPAKNVDLDTALYSKYCKFQVAHTGRIGFLKAGSDGSQQFEIPDVEDGDKCMPPLLVKFNTKLRSGAPQPADNYKKKRILRIRFSSNCIV